MEWTPRPHGRAHEVQASSIFSFGTIGPAEGRARPIHFAPVEMRQPLLRCELESAPVSSGAALLRERGAQARKGTAQVLIVHSTGRRLRSEVLRDRARASSEVTPREECASRERTMLCIGERRGCTRKGGSSRCRQEAARRFMEWERDRWRGQLLRWLTG